MNDWHRIWEKERATETAPSVLSTLLLAGGYDAFGAVAPETWTAHVGRMTARLGLQPGASVFDVGCGAGAFLWPLRELGHPVGGLDYSSRQIAQARRAMPGVADFEVGEADSLAATPLYDAVVACGTFLYFEDHDYAEKAALRMLTKAKDSIAILDVPDLAKKEESLRWRKAALSPEVFQERYAGLPHLHYAKDWFRSLFGRLSLECAIEDQSFPGYSHTPFRFNVFAWKAGAGHPRNFLAPGEDVPEPR